MTSKCLQLTCFCFWIFCFTFNFMPACMCLCYYEVQHFATFALILLLTFLSWASVADKFYVCVLYLDKRFGGFFFSPSAMSANYTAQGCHPVKALGKKKNLPYRSETFSLKSAITVRGKRTEDLRLILFINIDVALQHQLLLWEGFIKINLVTTFWVFFFLSWSKDKTK